MYRTGGDPRKLLRYGRLERGVLRILQTQVSSICHCLVAVGEGEGYRATKQVLEFVRHARGYLGFQGGGDVSCCPRMILLSKLGARGGQEEDKLGRAVCKRKLGTKVFRTGCHKCWKCIYSKNAWWHLLLGQAEEFCLHAPGEYQDT